MMKPYVFLFVGLASVFLILFGIGSVVLPVTWHNPSEWLATGYISSGIIGIGLLIIDVLLPVPSTLVMTAFGTIHGILVGTLLSLIGNLGAAMFGFWLGRRSNGFLTRNISSNDRAAASAFLDDWGALGIILSRPIPILAESVAILAGTTTSISWSRLIICSLIGALPASLIYAWAGAQAVTLKSGLLVLGSVILLAVIFFQLSKFYYRQNQNI